MPVKNQQHNFPRPGRRCFVWPGKAGLFLLLVLSRIPQAQQQFQDQVQSQTQGSGMDALAPSPAPAVPQTQNEQANPGAFQVFNPNGAAPDSLDQPFQYGRLIFRPHVLYRFLYGNGIQSAPGAPQKTVVQQFSPGILVNLGPDWVLDYTPTLIYYSSPEFANTVNQSVILRGGTEYQDWTLGLSQSYFSVSTPTVETGTQLRQDSYITALSASRELNSTVSLDLAVNQDFEATEMLESTRDWSSLDWLNFKISPRMNFGLGAGGGYDSPDSGPGQVYEQAQGRYNWRVSDRFSLSANGGVEDRQYQEGGQADLISPIYGGSVQYQPFDYTTIALLVNNSVSQSFFVGQVVKNSVFGLDVTQRLLGKLHLDLNGGYTIEKYVATTDTPVATSLNRKDDYLTFTARLSCPLLKRGTAGIFYQYSHNQSTADGFTYGSTQIGFDLGYTY